MGISDEEDEWDRPRGTRYPNRPGDPTPHDLFLALGQAVSAWEGVNAAISNLFYAVGNIETPDLYVRRTEDFADTENVGKKIKRINEKLDSFFQSIPVSRAISKKDLRSRIKRCLADYSKAASRRNDLAHGYVTEAWTQDYYGDQEKIVRSFSLCPAHSRNGRWLGAQPEFNYIAKEIRAIAHKFESLDAEIELTAKQADALAGRSRDDMSAQFLGQQLAGQLNGDLAQYGAEEVVTVIATRFTPDEMWLTLSDGRTLGVPLAWFPRLLDATPEQRAEVRIGRYGLHWEALDEDISLQGLLAGRGDRTRRSPAA